LATKKRGAGSDSDQPKKPQASGGGEAKRPARRPSTPARPRIRASHEGPGRTEGSAPRRPRRAAAGEPGAPFAPRNAPSIRKAPLTGPRRAAAAGRRTAPPLAEPSAAARELALTIAAAGIDKKALGIEILDVTGKVDYADFLVIMTGRSDRHVHAISTGLEESLRKKKVNPISVEGLGAATWVLIDFGDVVVHVFQEEARKLYDIEGLWIDASRVPVPGEAPDAQRTPSDF
jgi:ribosome-associated protein